jgi:hypothetical protein
MSFDQSVVPGLAKAYDERDGQQVVAAVKVLVETTDSGRWPALWHPLGFFRWELASDHMRRRYVLHCWPKGERHTQNPAWLVHRHAFELESLILDGDMRDRQFQAAGPATAHVRGPLYRAEGGSSLSVLQRTTNVAELAEASEQNLTPGHFYGVGIDRFHESQVRRNGSCVTLARILPKVRSHAHVVGEFQFSPLLRYVHLPVEPGLLVRLVDCVRGL